ncbi:hypothetical protein B1R94_09865 [Mycolicibacterium litorale]|nr:hypothetical protein B1R94_09865 [Mycolicibacterium litorale]
MLDVSARLGEAARRTSPQIGSTRLIAIDGPSGAGKTSLSQSLAPFLQAPIIHLDAIYEGWKGLDGIGIQLKEWVIDALAAERDPRWRPWDWDDNVRSEHWQHVPVGDFLLIEGCGAGDAGIAAATALLIWVQAPQSDLDARLRARDDWASYEPHREQWLAQEARAYARNKARERADAIVVNGPEATVEFVRR